MPTKPPSGSDDATSPVPVYILAGGHSRRYGKDKARVLVDGRPLINTVASELETCSTSITVVAREKDTYADLGLRTIGDSIEGKGPMGGLLTAVEDADDDTWIFITACDWLGIRSEWLKQLLGQPRDSAQAVVYRSELYQPLFGLYHTSIRDIVLEHVKNDDVKMQNLLDSLATVSLPPPHDWDKAINMNRPGSTES